MAARADPFSPRRSSREEGAVRCGQRVVAAVSTAVIIFIVISSQLKAKAIDEGKGEWIVMLLRERHRI